MQVRDIDIRSYYDCQDYMQDKFVKKLAHNTYVVARDGHYEVTYHGHTIARFYPTHTTVHNCGYSTTTTKQRLNCLIPRQFGIYQKNYEWFVHDRRHGTDFAYYNGMAFESDGE